MTVKRTADDAQAPRKRAKLDPNSRGTYKYSSAGELRASLKNQNQDALVEGLLNTPLQRIRILTKYKALTSIRNQLTIKPYEGPIAPQDARLTLAQSWLETSPGAHDIFDIWEVTNQVRLYRHIYLQRIYVNATIHSASHLSSHFSYPFSLHSSTSLRHTTAIMFMVTLS